MESFKISSCPHENALAHRNVKESDLKVVFLDRHDRIAVSSQAFAKFLHTTSTSLEGKTLSEVMPWHHPTYLSKKKQAIGPADIDIVNFDMSLPDGTQDDLIHVTLQLARSETDGSVDHQRLILRTGEERIAHLKSIKTGEHTHSIVAAVDEAGFFTKCEGSLALNIIPRIVGRHFMEVYEGMTDTQDRIRRALNGESFDVELFTRGNWFHVWYFPIFSERGHVVGATWTSFPINQQKLAHLKLQRESATEIKAREELLSIASHEVRNPLSALSLQLQLMDRYLETKQDPEKILPAIKSLVQQGTKQIQHVVKLLDKTLDISSVSENGLTLELSTCNLVEILQNSYARLLPKAEAGNTIMTLNAPGELWGLFDSARMEQVFDNLISNAIKYGEQRPVQVNLTQANGCAVFCVQDNGAGIPAADCEKIFDRFVRVNQKKSIAGFGMGLYIVKQIVTAHQGTIEVQSSPGEGTLFGVKLPINF